MKRNLDLPGEIDPVSVPLPPEKNGHHPAELAKIPETSSASPSASLPRISLWRMFALPILLALACGGSALVVTSFFMTRWYRSAVTLYFPATGGQGASNIISQITGGGGGDPSIGFNGGLSSVPLVGTTPGMIMSVMATGRVQSKVMQDLHLDKRWHLPADQAMARLNKSMSYGIDRNGFLAVQAQDTDPNFTVVLVNEFVRATQQVSTDLSTYYAKRNLQLEQRHLQDLKIRLLSEQNALAKIQMQASRSTPLGTGAQSAYQALEAQRQDTETSLRQAKAALAARLHTAQVTTQNAVNLPAQMPYAQQAHQRLSDLENQFAATKATYGPDYPLYQQQEAQVQQAQTAYEDEVKRETMAVQKGITPDVAQLNATVQGLQAKLDGIHEAAAPLRSDLQSLPLDLMRQTRLQDAISLDTAQERQATLDTQRAQEVEEHNTPAFEVVDAAGVPHDPVLPRVGFTTAFAVIAGFLLGLAWKIGTSVKRSPIVIAELYRLAEKYSLLDRETPPEALPARTERAPQPSLEAEARARKALEMNTDHSPENL